MYTIKGPQLLTYGREDFPVYCAHEPLMELQDIKAHGAPFVVIEPAHEIGKQHCNFIIYKDKSKIPAKYYARPQKNRCPIAITNSYSAASRIAAKPR